MSIAVDPVQVIADSPLLRPVDRSSLEGLGSELEWVVLDAHEVLILDGSREDALYFVSSGRLEFAQPGEDADGDNAQAPAPIIPGDIIAEMTTGSRGLVELRGAVPTRLVRLERSRLERYLATHPPVANRLQDAFIPLFYRSKIVRILRDMFGELTEDMLTDIEPRLTWRLVARGDVVFRQGELSAGLLVVVSGRLQELGRNGAGEGRIVNQIVEGEIAGEVGVFTDESQTSWRAGTRSFSWCRAAVFAN